MANDTTANTRYGIASGKRMNDTICDREFNAAWSTFGLDLAQALNPNCPIRRFADRAVKDATRRLVRAALDVERQRSFERGIEAFAAMPMVRERHDEGRSNRWTPGTFQGD